VLQFYREDHGNKRQTIEDHIFYSICLKCIQDVCQLDRAK
jgi:hypothetical protein